MSAGVGQVELADRRHRQSRQVNMPDPRMRVRNGHVPHPSVRQRAVLASLATRVRLNDEHRIGMAIVSRRLRRSSSATEPTQRALSGESSARRVQVGVNSRHGEGMLEAFLGCR